ncbi:MAG: DEAD/DEAH box helicase [Myxococcota bacterium]|nr:DEAD/DEAH box helicase [Myxococcota bacterium]
MKLTLRNYQIEAIESALAARRQGHRRLLICLPTGAGKTVIFSELCRIAKGHVLVLAHREELLFQARDKILRTAQYSFQVDIEQADLRASQEAKVVVASIRSLRAERLMRLNNAHNFSLIIYDECHHAAADDNKRILQELGCFDPNWSGTLIGFTATANRADGIGLGEIFELIVYQRNILEMIHDDYLVPLRGYRVNTNVELHQILKNTGRYSQEELAEAVDIESRNVLVARAIQELARDRRTIVFCVTVVHAINVAKALNAIGLPAAPVYGAMESDKRASTLKSFREGRLMTLTNVGVLTEGFDDPGVSCIAMARPTRSEALYAQCVGRGARLAPNKTDCLVLDFVDLSDLSLVNLPSLLGLPKSLNLEGADVSEVCETYHQLCLQYHGFEIEANEITLQEIKHRAESFDPLTMEINPEITAITPNGWCTLGAHGLALYYFDQNELCRATITRNSKRRGKKYTVEINGHPVASFSRILDAVEATDFELQKISQQAAWSARDDADWRNAAVTSELQDALAQLRPPRRAETLGNALAYLIFSEYNSSPTSLRNSTDSLPIPIWKNGVSSNSNSENT